MRKSAQVLTQAIGLVRFASIMLMKSITGCAVAQHCCNDDQQSQWENGDFDPCRSETPKNFITKIGNIDYVAGDNTHAKFYVNRPRGARPTNS